MTSHLAEYFTLRAVFALAAITPGPDFAMVVRQSVVHGRRAGVVTSLGVGSAMLFHASYTLAGIGLLVAHSILAFNVLKWLGAAYLVYVGIKTFRAPAMSMDLDAPAQPLAAGTSESMSDARSFGLGFLTNALNPKAVLFFLSLFGTLVSADTPVALQVGYALSMSALLMGWFTLVSFFFTGRTVRAQLARAGRWFNRLTGGALIALGVRLALQRAHTAA